MITTEYVEDTVLPYRIQMDALMGAAMSPSEAALAALSVGGKIPHGWKDKKKVINYIRENYAPNSDLDKLIRILITDLFE